MNPSICLILFLILGTICVAATPCGVDITVNDTDTGANTVAMIVMPYQENGQLAVRIGVSDPVDRVEAFVIADGEREGTARENVTDYVLLGVCSMKVVNSSSNITLEITAYKKEEVVGKVVLCDVKKCLEVDRI